MCIGILIAAVVVGMAVDPAEVLAPDDELAANHPPLDPGYDPIEFVTDYREGRYIAGTIGLGVEFIPGNDLPGRKKIIGALEDVVSPHLKRIKDVAGENAIIGFRGSLATGIKGPHKLAPDGSRLPFDATNFDVDAFIVSDELAALYGDQNMRWGERIGALDDLSIEVQEALKELPEFEGLRDKGFSFRIFTQEEADRIFDGTEYLFEGE